MFSSPEEHNALFSLWSLSYNSPFIPTHTMDDIINISSVTPLRPNNVQDIPLSSHFSLVDCLLIDIYTLNLLNTIDRYYCKEKITNFDIYIPTQSCVNLMVILFKRICVNILISPFLIQFIHVGYRLFNKDTDYVVNYMIFSHSKKMTMQKKNPVLNWFLSNS